MTILYLLDYVCAVVLKMILMIIIILTIDCKISSLANVSETYGTSLTMSEQNKIY